MDMALPTSPAQSGHERRGGVESSLMLKTSCISGHRPDRAVSLCPMPGARE